MKTHSLDLNRRISERMKSLQIRDNQKMATTKCDSAAAKNIQMEMFIRSKELV